MESKIFPRFHSRSRNSRIIHHANVRISSTSMIQNSTPTLEVIESAYSTIPFSYLSLLSLKDHISNLEKKMPNSLNCSRLERFVLLEQVVVQKTFPIIPVQFCVFRGNPESQRGQSSGTQNRRSLIRNVGRFRAAPRFRIIKFSSHLTRNSLCSEDPEFEPSSDSRS